MQRTAKRFKNAALRILRSDRRDSTSEPSGKFARDEMKNKLHPLCAGIQAGNQGKIFTAILTKEMPVLDIDLLQGLETIGRKSRRHDDQIFDTLARQGDHGFVCIGLQPFRRPETRLVAHADGTGREAEGFCQQAEGFFTMPRIEVASVGIGFRNAVIRNEDDIRREGQTGKRLAQ